MARDIAALYEAVYANPDDDGPRLVLADALQEAGDPRGEFIALQLARKAAGKTRKGRRESQLLRMNSERPFDGRTYANLRAWLGPLIMAVPNKGLVYERGFVAKVQLQHHRESIEPYLGPPEWHTVEEVTLGRWKGSLQLLADSLPALRVLGEIEWGHQVPSHPRLETIRMKFVDAESAAHLATRKLPSLKQLEIGWCYATKSERAPMLKAFGKRVVILH
jgi:uncharacterized protein (TIGR02996 family)